jgi:methionine sulfoxide reductase heme-binding subunit
MKITKIQFFGNLIGLIPAVYLIYETMVGDLSANPIQTATVITGRTSIYAILFSLFCTPLAQILNLSVFHRIRKIAGLFGFYYAFAHFLIFALLDYQLNFSWILPEIQQKPFLQIGLIALVALIPLAITSIGVIKRKMGKTWKKLQYFIYLITALILLHVALASKGDMIDPAILISLYVIAMIFRLPKLRSMRVKKLPEWLARVNKYLIT